MLLQARPSIWSIEWVNNHAIPILLVIALGLVVGRVGKVAVRRYRSRIEGDPDVTGGSNLKRTATLVTIMAAAVRVVVWTIVALMILAEIGLNLGPLIASAGIVGVALGFGAQSLVRDFLSGFFILLENQFGVGDAVEISAVGGTVTGRVETMTLRTTEIRQHDGTLTVIPNGNMHVISNKSRGRGELIVEVRVPLTDEPAKLRVALEKLVDEMRTSEWLRSRVSSGPDIAGVERDGEEALLKVAVETRASRRPEVEAEIRKRIEHRFVKLVASPDGGPRGG